MSRYFRITQKGYEGMSSIETTEKIDNRLQELVDKEVIPFLAVQHYPTMLYSIIEIMDDALDSDELFKLLKIKDYRQTTEEEISFENRLKEMFDNIK